MTRYELKDDTDKIRSDAAHDVFVGGMAKVSIGGMRQVTVTVTGIGKSGIACRDENGRSYHLFWSHVIGPVKEKAKDKPKKEAENGDYSDILTDLATIGQQNNPPSATMSKALMAQSSPIARQHGLYDSLIAALVKALKEHSAGKINKAQLQQIRAEVDNQIAALPVQNWHSQAHTPVLFHRKVTRRSTPK